MRLLTVFKTNIQAVLANTNRDTQLNVTWRTPQENGRCLYRIEYIAHSDSHSRLFDIRSPLVRDVVCSDDDLMKEISRFCLDFDLVSYMLDVSLDMKWSQGQI